jgi:hypothetical protein
MVKVTEYSYDPKSVAPSTVRSIVKLVPTPLVSPNDVELDGDVPSVVITSLLPLLRARAKVSPVTGEFTSVTALKVALAL